MNKLKITKIVLSLLLVVSVVSSVTSITSNNHSDSGTVSILSVDDWGWMIETR